MKSPLILTLSLLSLLAACGGSSNDGGGEPPVVDTTITSANALLVTQVAYQAALATGSIGDLSGSTGLIAATPGGVSKIDGSFATANSIGGSTASVPIPPTVDNCIPSGTMTVSGEIADPFTPTLTPDDFFDVDFDLCNDGFTVTDGDLHYVVDAFTGNFLGGVYDLTMTATLTDFQVTTASDVLTSNGDATVRLDTQQLSNITVVVSGSSLTVDKTASSETQSNFSSTQSQNAEVLALPYTLITSATLDSTQLSGVVEYSTTTMFEGNDVDYPHTGVLLITGVNSSARLTAIDNVNILIEIDTNGDGNINETINTTWAELDGV